jgi:hypothetical protein
MPTQFHGLLHHPRRLGFLIFNAIVVVLIVAWGVMTSGTSADGVASLPSLLIGPVGTMLLLALLVAGWGIWIGFVLLRRIRHDQS